MLDRIRRKRGFTMIEILIGIAIMAVLGGILFTSFGKLNDNQALDTSTMLVTSVLNEARSSTLASKSASNYGVHIESSRVVLFKGSTYSSSDSSNDPNSINTKVGIRNISLSGGGSDVVFDRLTGATSEPGTLELYLLSDTTISKTITISGTGAVQ